MNWYKQKKFWLILAVLLLLLAGWFFWSDRASGIETVLAGKMDLTQTVSLTGRVESPRKVDLALEQSGRVVSLPYKVGDRVPARATLVSLESGVLFADLRAAEARLALARLQTQNTEVNLDKIKEQQDTLVANAYRELLSTDLVVVPSSGSYTMSAPLVSGLYDGPEGRYKIIVGSGPSFNQQDYRLFTFDLEQTRDVKISTTDATSLGTHGLFISFPDELSSYADTIWYLSLPNTKSHSYLSKYNAYQNTLRNRDRAIEEAQASLVGRANSELTVAQAELAVAQAELDRLRAELAKRQLRAPFAGLLTKLETELGETVSAGVILAGLISDQNYQIEARVPEADIARLKIGDRGGVTLDAYGDEAMFDVEVAKIDPAETIIEGVPTYLMTLKFLTPDERIKSGMTANIELVTAKKDDVLAIPARALRTSGDKKTVRILVQDKLVSRVVETGLRDAGGNIEITRGLRVGDEVVIYVPNNG